MLKSVQYDGDWKKAFEEVIPARKFEKKGVAEDDCLESDDADNLIDDNDTGNGNFGQSSD
jgi:hypothetical protein